MLVLIIAPLICKVLYDVKIVNSQLYLSFSSQAFINISPPFLNQSPPINNTLGLGGVNLGKMKISQDDYARRAQSAKSSKKGKYGVTVPIPFKGNLMNDK
jgi:hypothetical protein